MITFSTIKDTVAYIQQQRNSGRSVGFVPTMGALHEGHLQLMRQAKKENDVLVVSIFVNPIQFNNPSDLDKYPRDLDKDQELLETVGCDLLFAPETSEMYPEKVVEDFDFGPLETVMEGAHRPGHFNGVAIVVKKLFEIVQPHQAYFGEKDYQQLAIIQKLVEMENIPVEIVPCSIVREKGGLAMSSRNERLSPEEKALAPFIFQTLQQAVNKKGMENPETIKRWVIEEFKSKKQFQLEYFEIADDKNLQPVHNWKYANGVLGFVAVHLGNIRLIDNIRII